MADGGLVQWQQEGGTAASHPATETSPMRVAPATGQGFNTLALDLNPVACLELRDILFEFDSSFVRPSAAEILGQLPALRDARRSLGRLPRMSVFGHADPVGTEVYNAYLSARRARAVYGVLTGSVDTWSYLYHHAYKGDDWRQRGVAVVMRDTTGLPDGRSSADLIAAYLAYLFPNPFTDADFLGNGAADGRASYQGCGKCNPRMVMSTDEEQHYAAPENHQDRDAQNQQNRRVVVFLYCAARRVNPPLWPCPTSQDDTAACQARFFSDGEQRRSPQDARRTYEKDGNTFACRFYDRMARVSPCEGRRPVLATVRVCFYTCSNLSEVEGYQLENGDGTYSEILSRSALTPVDDNFLELRFLRVLPAGSYSLYQTFGDDNRIPVFEDVPFQALYDSGMAVIDGPVEPFPKQPPDPEPTFDSADPLVPAGEAADSQLAAVRDPHLENVADA